MIELVEKLTDFKECNMHLSDFIEVINAGDIGGVKDFLRTNKQINVKTIKVAFQKNQTEIALLLINAVNRQMSLEDALSLYNFSTINKNIKLIDSLDFYASNFAISQKESILCEAINGRDIDLFRYLVEFKGFKKGVTFNVAQGMVITNNENMLDYVLNGGYGFSVHTLANFAVKNYNFRMAKYLIGKGANLSGMLRIAKGSMKEKLLTEKERVVLSKELINHIKSGTTGSKGFKI